MNELKPCPFCGSEAEVIVTEKTWMGPSLILIRCKNGPCSCQTPTLVNSDNEDNFSVNIWKWNREKALVDIWNRRALEMEYVTE